MDRRAKGSQLKGHALPGPDTYKQIPALAERGRARILHFFSLLDARLSDNEFICSQHFTIADITGDGHRRPLWLGKAQGAGAFNPSTSLAFDGFSAS
jgi:glutathione S-transferase